MIKIQKPEPKPNTDSQTYWDACNREELIYQFCDSCGRAQFYPRGRCIHCNHSKLTWRISAGYGAIYAVTQIHVGQAAFQDDAPYPLALIELDEGFRIMTNIIGEDSDLAVIGARGHIAFERRGEFRIPQFLLDHLD